ncbi:flagellar basal body protein FliL [Salipiger aestuarii]|uniref:Flagellar protein FliL n=1 Tax=Salipiger aestuarii TaxID=568098 RepID=A0A327XWI9_9RHOB|nr:flagellar basal body-associated FliL family protein [Salipiger aestuarii]EIE49857.1 flagellar basal body-associated protein FliL [Citreicella sp. 357]KAB2541156.1 flagellar basal body protein FliL [Salipiger aestuarii]RAK13388.1 flagellar FliL protein [Salipiger aestuarii]
MTDATADVPNGENAARKSSKLPLVIGIALALAGGAGGFFAAFSGLLPFGAGGAGEEHAAGAGSDSVGAGRESGGEGHATGSHATDDHGAATGVSPVTTAGSVAFVELPQLVVSMGAGSSMNHLRFQASLEVVPTAVADVESLQPRVMDVLNNYLRALAPSDIEASGALIKIRSQMLRRIQMVTGENRVRDLLIMEFVLN